MATITRTDQTVAGHGSSGERAGATLVANAGRNASREPGRRRRWRPARDALWSVLDRHVAEGASVAIVGAGNGDDVPLRRLSRRAGRVDLIDLDSDALAYARRGVRRRRSRVRACPQDVTGGAADAIVARALGRQAHLLAASPIPIGENGPYDVVVADLVLTQLLYPALLDAGLPAAKTDATLLSHGQALTDAVAARLHASAPGGVVIYVHDMLGWWPGHPQPFEIDDVVELVEQIPSARWPLRSAVTCHSGATPG